MSSKIPTELRYTANHEWIRREGDLFTLGITDYAQDNLGDVVMVDFPEVGDALIPDEVFGAIESPKSVSDLFAPLEGEVTEINEALDMSPEQVNDAPYGDGWLIRFRAQDPDAFDSLLDAEAYAALITQLDT